MDILYILGEGCSRCDNLELKCSLRSVAKYGKNVGRIFVAGYCPDWLSDEVVKVPFTQPWPKLRSGEAEAQDNLAKKHANMTATILHVVDNTDISDEFLVSMDDHFYIRNVDFENYPFYCKRYGANNELPVAGKSEYRKFLATTKAKCEEDGISKFYLSLHRNMHCSRKTIAECRELLEEVVSVPTPLEPFAYMLNWRHAKDADFEPTIVRDWKLKGGRDWWKADPEKTEVFSAYDFGPGLGMATLLKGLYNQKSQYEK